MAFPEELETYFKKQLGLIQKAGDRVDMLKKQLNAAVETLERRNGAEYDDLLHLALPLKFMPDTNIGSEVEVCITYGDEQKYVNVPLIDGPYFRPHSITGELHCLATGIFQGLEMMLIYHSGIEEWLYAGAEIDTEREWTDEEKKKQNYSVQYHVDAWNEFVAGREGIMVDGKWVKFQKSPWKPEIIEN